MNTCKSPKAGGYSPSELTMRPLEDYVRYQAWFFSLFHTLEFAKKGFILDFGSGSGRAMLNLTALYPSIQAFGTNLKGYNFVEMGPQRRFGK